MSIMNFFKRIGRSPMGDFRRAADRITEIRASGLVCNTIDTMHQSVKISNDDHLLMGCDNSTARRNFPQIPDHERNAGRWFSGADDFDVPVGNYHATERKDGTMHIESFYANLPRPEYQAAPEEVAWHYVRVKQLRAQGLPQPDRMRMMEEEARGKPWLNLNVPAAASAVGAPAADAAAQPLKWLPIDTAPKDRQVLIYVPIDDVLPKHCVQWGQHCDGPNWLVVDAQCGDSALSKPTLWFPLPDPEKT